jgi:hypothetical protein
MQRRRSGATDIYEHGNIRISDGKLRIGNESLPLVNIVSATRQKAHRPRQHWTTLMIVAGIVMLSGVRFIHSNWGLALLGVGAAMALWTWFLHRDRMWLVRLNLLLNQRISVMFEEVGDADGFLDALKAAKGGQLPIRATDS